MGPQSLSAASVPADIAAGGSPVERIVYFSFPAHGHINPTLPVIRELARREEQVVYFSTERFRRIILDTGAAFCPYSAEFRMPERGPGPFARISTTLETLLELSRVALDRHLEQVRKMGPTHIMHDSFAPWGRFVAQLLRLPSVASIPSIPINKDIDARYGRGPGTEPADPRLTAQWYAEFRSRCHAGLLGYGLAEIPAPPQLLQTYGDFNLAYTSRLFQPLAEAFDGDRFKFVGPCFEFRPEAPPFPFERLDGRPLVLVSLGTVYGNRPHFLRLCLAELANAPWQVVLSTGGCFPAEDLGAIPDNCIVRTVVPQIEILRRSAAFVTHAGMNGVQEALYHGVPLVMAPQAADQFWISARACELGAGLALDPNRMEAGDLRAGVAKVVSEGSYAAAAARIGASLRAAGGHMRAADEIQGFMHGGCRPADILGGRGRPQETMVRPTGMP
jgi:MGT family glycosyltransferase